MLTLSQLHFSFTNYPSAIRFFKIVLNQIPILETPEQTIFKIENLELVFNPDWGEGDTIAILRLLSKDCDHDYAQAMANGARSKSAPSVVGDSLIATVFGPGKILIEFEQALTKEIT